MIQASCINSQHPALPWKTIGIGPQAAGSDKILKRMLGLFFNYKNVLNVEKIYYDGRKSLLPMTISDDSLGKILRDPAWRGARSEDLIQVSVRHCHYR